MKKIQYKLTTLPEKDFTNHTIKISILQLESKYSIILVIHNRMFDSYYVKQFENDIDCIKYMIKFKERK